MNIYAEGETVRLSVLLEDGESTRYPQAYIYQSGVKINTIDLPHVENGLYEQTWVPPDSDQFNVIYQVYIDPSHTLQDNAYGVGLEQWKALDLMTNPIVNDVLTAKIADYSAVSGSLAEAIEQLEARLTLARAINLDDIPNILLEAETSRKLLKNRLELSDGSTNNWILYDDDAVTPLILWNVRDKDGEGIRLPKYAPARRAPQ